MNRPKKFEVQITKHADPSDVQALIDHLEVKFEVACLLNVGTLRLYPRRDADADPEEDRPEFEVEDTTFERDESGDGDREWDVEERSCDNCGEVYPADYTRCPECGIQNPQL